MAASSCIECLVHWLFITEYASHNFLLLSLWMSVFFVYLYCTYDLHVSKKGYVKYTDNVYNKSGEKCTYIFVCLDIS